MANLKKTLLDTNAGNRVLLLGNEAIVRGILESGIGVITTYPGTPASEIADTTALIAEQAGLYMEYSTNEIVALEVAAGAALCKVRALAAMKHVGLNVASDALMTLAYTGVRGGLVVVTADDPECYSSQNEQDNRYYALLSNLPMLEPSDGQEAKDMIREAIEISEKLEIPCLLRTTTRVAHTRTPVIFGEIQKPNMKGEFIKDSKRFVMVPANARTQHKALLEKVEKAKKISEESRLNRITQTGKDIGIITSGGAYNYAAEAVGLLGLDASILKLGMINPVPEDQIANFLRSHQKVIVVEELEPYLETQIRAIAQTRGLSTRIYGKTEAQHFPKQGELSTRIVVEGLAKILNREIPVNFAELDTKSLNASQILLPRPPLLCAGCPHRASFYIIKTATAGKAICPTDIGCYALGVQQPLMVGDVLICMGGSIGTAGGISKVTGSDTVAIVGDSTFFHAAIPGLINAVYNNHKATLVVLDNITTAMTGHQPHPGIGKTGMGAQTVKVSIEEVAKACGVEYVKVVDPLRVKEATALLKDALKQKGPAVIVFRSPCTLLSVSEKRRKGIKVIPCKVTEKCTNCMACIKLLGCPALDAKEGKLSIDETLCTGCMLCAAVCPYKTIEGGDS